MDKRVEELGYNVVYNSPGDGDCFYASAARALRIETQGLKNVIFEFLKSHQFDVSIQTYSTLWNDEDKFVVSICSDLN